MALVADVVLYTVHYIFQVLSNLSMFMFKINTDKTDTHTVIKETKKICFRE